MGEEVSLSVGRDDGAFVGRRFDIYRENSYIGKVEVREVDSTSSRARILPAWTREKILKGDQAKSGPVGPMCDCFPIFNPDTHGEVTEP